MHSLEPILSDSSGVYYLFPYNNRWIWKLYQKSCSKHVLINNNYKFTFAIFINLAAFLGGVVFGWVIRFLKCWRYMFINRNLENPERSFYMRIILIWENGPRLLLRIPLATPEIRSRFFYLSRWPLLICCSSIYLVWKWANQLVKTGEKY